MLPHSLAPRLRRLANLARSLTPSIRRAPAPLRAALVAALVLGGTISAQALLSSSELATVKAVHTPAFDEHVDQAELNELVEAGDHHAAFELAFELGDEIFESEFNAVDGGGAVVHGHERYSRVPRADQRDTGEWWRHTPARATGPNAAACNHCHIQGGDDGSGVAAANVHRDTLRNGQLAQFIQRATPPTSSAWAG